MSPFTTKLKQSCEDRGAIESLPCAATVLFVRNLGHLFSPGPKPYTLNRSLLGTLIDPLKRNVNNPEIPLSRSSPGPWPQHLFSRKAAQDLRIVFVFHK